MLGQVTSTFIHVPTALEIWKLTCGCLSRAHFCFLFCSFSTTRIAILKDGVLQASGSSAFLKKRFGLGYNLSLDILMDHRDESSAHFSKVFDATEFEVKKNRIRQFLETSIPDIQLSRTLGSEVIFRVPNGSEERLPLALSTLDMNRRSLGVGAFGIENASLEEVVLLLSEDSDEHVAIPHDITASTTGEASCSTITGSAGGVVLEPSPSSFLPVKEMQASLEPLSWTGQVGLLYWKRFTVQRRDLKGFLFAVVAPTLVVALVLLILTVNLNISGPAMEMSPTALGNRNNDVMVGGGAALRNRLSTRRDITEKFEGLQSVLQPLYGNTQLHQLPNVLSSRDMSDYLLLSYDNYNGNERYATYVLHDIVEGIIGVDWPYYKEDIKQLLNTTLEALVDADVELAMERLINVIYNITGTTVGFLDDSSVVSCMAGTCFACTIIRTANLTAFLLCGFADGCGSVDTISR